LNRFVPPWMARRSSSADGPRQITVKSSGQLLAADHGDARRNGFVVGHIWTTFRK
jgi:hypothetical protein